MPKRTKEFRQTARMYSASHATIQRRNGLTRISLWVPDEDAERLRDIAAQLRADAGKPLPADGCPSPRSVEVPVVEPRFPDDARVWLKVDQDELGLHMLLRSNGGEWRGQRNLWEVPASLPAKLGLSGRVIQA